MNFDEFLGEMQKIITASQQGNLFGDKEGLTKNCREACVEYLKGQGCSISQPHNYPIKATKPDDLIKMFYWKVRQSFPDHLWAEDNIKKDRAIAKAFIERRMRDDCVDKKTAMVQCAYIIDTVLKRSDVFRFESPPNFGIFGQGEMAWVTTRAIQLVNKEITKEELLSNGKAVEAATEKIYKNYPKLGHTLTELEAMQRRLEARYGKKEKQT